MQSRGWAYIVSYINRVGCKTGKILHACLLHHSSPTKYQHHLENTSKSKSKCIRFAISALLLLCLLPPSLIWVHSAASPTVDSHRVSTHIRSIVPRIMPRLGLYLSWIRCWLLWHFHRRWGDGLWYCVCCSSCLGLRWDWEKGRMRYQMSLYVCSQ